MLLVKCIIGRSFDGVEILVIVGYQLSDDLDLRVQDLGSWGLMRFGIAGNDHVTLSSCT